MTGWFGSVVYAYQAFSKLWNAFGGTSGLAVPATVAAFKINFNTAITLILLIFLLLSILCTFVYVLQIFVQSSTTIAMHAFNGNNFNLRAFLLALVTIAKNLSLFIVFTMILYQFSLPILKTLLSICLYHAGLEEYAGIFLGEAPKKCSGWLWKTCK